MKEPILNREKWIEAGMFPTTKNPPMIKTRQEFDELDINFLDYYDWFDIAHLINGYALLAEIGIDEHPKINIWIDRRETYQKDKQRWDLPLFDLMILLFFHARSLKMDPRGQDYDYVNTLLIEIAEHLGIAYSPNKKDRQWVIERKRRDIEFSKARSRELRESKKKD